MHHPTVMLVDDDSGMLSALAKRCEALGLETMAFTDLREAVRAATDAVPDLIVLDVLMPSGNGLEICEQLMQDERLKSTRIVMLTGEASPETRLRTQRAGAHFVRKGNHVWDRLKPILEREFGLVAQEAA